MRRFILAAFALIVLAACQPATTELTEEQKAEIADSITAAQDDLWQTWSTRELDSIMPLFVNSADVGWGFPGGMYYGYENLNAYARSLLDGVASANYTAAERRVDVLSWDVVLVRELGTYSWTDTAGAARQLDDYPATTIWVRRDGEWKVIHYHESYRPLPESQGQ
jgi:uncharacterized protein (TIGR02246 family)